MGKNCFASKAYKLQFQLDFPLTRRMYILAKIVPVLKPRILEIIKGDFARIFKVQKIMHFIQRYGLLFFNSNKHLV